MAIPISIEKLLTDNIVESTRIEFKGGWNPEDILHSICAFANDIDNMGGGNIVVGINEKDGRPQYPVTGINVDSLDKIQKEFVRICHKIRPNYIPVCEPVQYQGKHLLLMWVPGGSERPYKVPVSLSDKNKVNAYYIRKWSNSVKASESMIKELHALGNNIPFDDRINAKADLKDLKIGLISDFLGTVGSSLYDDSLNMSIKKLSRDMRIADGSVEYYKPLNVGLMFFNDKPESFFRYAQIEIVNIPDPTGKNMVETYLKGPLDKQLKDALNYIQTRVIEKRLSKVSNQAEAAVVYNYPFAAVEEIVTNAVYHKSYQIYEPITIRIEKEQIVITSFPGPDRSISDEDIQQLKLIARRYRNRRIGDFLKELKLAEGRNTGIPTVIQALKDNHSPMPLFETDSDRSYFTVILKINPEFLEKISEEKQNLSKKKRRTRKEIEEEVLSVLSAGNLSQNEISRKMGYKAVSKTFSEIITKLISEGKIKHFSKQKLQKII